LDSTLAEAQLVLANVRTWWEWDWAGAETAFRQSIALNPNYPEARVYYSLLLTSTGRPEEGMAQIERAVELDPHNSFSQGIYGINLMWVGRYDDAIAQLRNTVTMVPAHRGALSSALHQERMFEEALSEARQYFAVMGRDEVAQALERGYAEAGYREAMRRAADTLAARFEQTVVAATDIAWLYVCAGERERALEWLERGFEGRDIEMVYLRVAPIWNSVRDDPRFQDLLRRMNLPQ
jgi:tetratricopeptide (TPR) repeat protein